MEDPFRECLQAGLVVKKQLTEFATILLQNDVVMAKAGDSWTDAFNSDQFEPVRECWQQFTQFARSLLSFFVAAVPEGTRAASEDDILYFTNYAGDGVFEKAIRRVFREPESWWFPELEEIIATGSATVLIADKVSQLQQLMQGQVTSSSLKEGLGLLKQVRGGTRSQKLGALLGPFQDTARVHR